MEAGRDWRPNLSPSARGRFDPAVLPYLDEHAADVAAGVDDVWWALVDTLDRRLGGPGPSAYARLVGCADTTASGPRPLAEGSTLVGFRVATATPGRQLVLEGRHRFSTYVVTFRLEAVDPRRTRVRAESRAAFPGRRGAVYRLLVVGTGGHVAVMRGLLAAIRGRAEQRGGEPVL